MKVISSQITTKGEFGTCEKSGRILFYKTLKDNFYYEINGYNLIKKLYKSPKRYSIDYQNRTVYYKYIKNIRKKLLHYKLYYTKAAKININSYFKNYFKSLKKSFVADDDGSINNKLFFKNRTFMLEDYLKQNTDFFSKEVLLNEKKYPEFSKTVLEIKSFIDNQKKNVCSITQGDPSDLNILKGNKVVDVESGGVNSLEGEISIFVCNLLVHGFYFFIKYENSPYSQWKKTYENNKDLVSCDYKIASDKIEVCYNLKILKKNKQALIDYLKNVKKNLKKEHQILLEKNLIKYICFRLLVPKNLNNFEEADKVFIIGITTDIFYNVTTISELILYINNLHTK